MFQSKSFITAVILLSLTAELTNSQTCSYMWDPVFEANSANPPTMCPVTTTSGSTCVFPFGYNGVTYTTCTVQGPNNANYQPQCAIAIDSNNNASAWSFCNVPTDAMVTYATVRKAGYYGQNGGSTQGGTLVWIYGNRFAENSFSSVPASSSANTVQLVDGYTVYDCEMHNDKTTTTQLTCYAPVLPESVYQIRVYVNGNLIPLYQYYDPTHAIFASMPSQTPTITGITPQTGTPNSLVTLTGNFETACYSRDVVGCAQDDNALISRIYMGGHLCNVINQNTGVIYAAVNDTGLECNFEGTEVGLFNVSMLVTNEFGRALVDPSLYRVSADETFYTFQSYAVISSVSPSTGSTAGGTTVTINGNYFSDSTQYPIEVNVGGQPCTVLGSTQTTIQCQTPAAPTGSQSRYQGGRGLQLYSTSGSNSQATLSSGSPPTPTGSPTWTDDALYVSSSLSAETAWLIGFVRVLKTANFTFILDTNGAGALYVSSDDNPTNKLLIASATSNQSATILLNNNTNYYLFAVGSRPNGNLRLGVQARMHETKLTASPSSLVLNEIQRITVDSSAISEQQQIAFTVSPTSGVSEVQSVQVDVSTFQIGFRGVYTAVLTGRPSASAVQAALNDLPSIYPLSVTVTATSTLYIVTFPDVMGNVPLLTCVSTSTNTPIIIETTQGVDSGTLMALELDGQLTNYLNFSDASTTQNVVSKEINNLFSIQCPPSISNATYDQSVLYLQDFESNCVYDETPITTSAFCGKCSYNGNSLLYGNTLNGNYLCFAYRLTNTYVTSLGLGLQTNGNTLTTIWASIPISLQADKFWHYTCVDLQANLLSQGIIDSTVSSFIITQAWLDKNIRNGIFLDVISLRTALPNAYENTGSTSIDKTANPSCVFPFYFNNTRFSACTLNNNNNLPVCADSSNITYQCNSSSIEGVRRLYPNHQLAYNTFRVTYPAGSSPITVSFRYTTCDKPTKFVPWPSSGTTVTRLATASDAANGTFDLVFNGLTYASIPVDILPLDLANRLQSSSDFGFLNIKRTGDCTGYIYTIEWIANGGQKTAISTANAGSILPSGTTVTASIVQAGGVLFNPLSGDLTRTYQTNPQIEVFVGGYPSHCTGANTCDYQWLQAQTPTVTSITQNTMTLTITGSGFSTTPSENNVTIGTSGTCTVLSATTSSLTCTIAAAPAGAYSVQVNVAAKGLATGTSSFSVNVPLQVTSITPIQGGAGGGMTLNVTGIGFTSSSSVTVGGNLCTNPIVSSFSLITCTVPPTTAVSNIQAAVVVTSGSSTATSTTQFTYDVTNTPSITTSSPSVVTMANGQLTITGTNFGTSSVAVYIGTTKATIQSLTSTQIVAVLPSLAPGIYPVQVSTAYGYARPAIQIEYRFYVQTISPQIGSLYGGSDVYVQGAGFDSSTGVSFTDGTNQIPCDIVSVQPNQIHCQTEAAAPRVIISANGVDPTYGNGFAWSPIYATVQQGAVVEWQWGLSALLSSLSYKVVQVANGSTIAPLSGGFDSGNATASGSYIYQFQTVGTYYYYTPPVDQAGLVSMRGVINVVAAAPRTLTVNVTSGSYTAQSCAFPFTFNSVVYTACTTVSDTQLWCSPTPTYTGQRLYCTPTATVPTPSCSSSSLINPSSCSQTVPSNALQFLFTPCTIGTVTSISPSYGPSGTSITVTGTGFSSTSCENEILIGTYQCPISSATSTQLTCQIGPNSFLNAKSDQSFNVGQVRQGFFSNDGLLEFQFLAQITGVSPTQGSTSGGTLVTITGDGFTPADTRVIVGSIEYTSSATITYSQIQFITQAPPSNYIDQTIPITILIGSNEAICSAGSCGFTWARSVTPSLVSVSPASISAPQTITVNGQNLDPTNMVSVSDVNVTINGESCTVTSVTNSTIACNIGSIPAGTYPVVASINGIGKTVSSASLISSATIANVAPTSGSMYGGVPITITGNGFARSASNMQITVGSSPCTIVSTTPGQVQCVVPPKGSNASPATINIVSNGITFPTSNTFTYSAASTPTISSISPSSGTVGQALTISGSNFIAGQTSVTIGGTICTITSVSSTSIVCTVNSSPAGSQPVIVTVSSTGVSASTNQFQYNLQVSIATPARGSFGGGQVVTVTGDGFNTPNISVTVCNTACQSVSVVSNTQLTCVTPAATYQVADKVCSLTVTVGSLSQSASYTYQASLTASVTSVSPARGGTGGGTTLTITGTNFPSTASGVNVSIAGVSCIVQTVSSTSITCFTGSYSQTTIQAPVIVNVVNGGNALGSAQFQYIDLWSSPWTWGGDSPPEQGTIVSIDSGKTVYFDTNTPVLKALIVDNATLIFDDNQDVSLSAEYILVVNGGRLQVGTEASPFQHKAIITMYGQLRSIELPIYGAKVLALRDGTVDMHGTNLVRTWTRLGSTAAAGATQITLSQYVDWPVNSQIVIATTGDYESQGETETRTITAVSSNGLTLTLDSPLTYQHLGVTQIVGSTSVEVRAEVGLLTRNVVFQGSQDTTWDATPIDPCPAGFNPGEFATQTCFLGRYGNEIGSDQFGATIMASASADSSDGIQRAILRLSNIEVTYAGQAFRLGRYPVHFHMNGNMSLSYIKSSSIHQTFNRAVNIHASNYLTVSNNVIYDVMGGAVFLEDGVETFNTLSYNLLVFVRTSSSLLNEDVTPAAIWVTNPNNIVEHNAVAGGTHFGYWYRLLETPDGPSFAMYPNFCPHRQQFGRFFNNSVHSVGRFGVWLFPEYSPTVSGSCITDNPYQAIIEGLISWKNSRGIEWVMSSTVQIKNALVFDNDDAGIRCVTAINNQRTDLPVLRSTFYNENTGSSVINSIIIGDTGVSGTPIVPDEGGLIVMWDRGLSVRNISFINFPNVNTQAIYGPTIDGRCVVYCGGWLTKFSQLRFTNVLNRGNFRWAYDGLYQDVDGSLANVPGAVILPPDGLWNTSSACSPTPNFVNAITCPSSMGTWIRFAFNQANLGQNGEELNIYDDSNHHTVVPNLHKRLTHPEGYMMNLLAKKSYLLQFENANSSVNISYSGVAYSLAPGDYLIIRHGVQFLPDQVNTVSSLSLVSESASPLTAASNNGDWYYDNTTQEFSYIVKNPSNNTIAADVTVTLNVVKCRYPNCQMPAQPGLDLPATARPADALYWGNDSDWSFALPGYGGYNSIKPGNNTDIYIPRGIWLVVNWPLPTILSLRIDGVLEFEQGMNNTLNVNSIFINGGQLIVGWPDTPLTSNVDIVITGSATVDVLLPNDAGSLGPRVIGVLGGLDLHGIAHNVSWTRLATTATAGQIVITLSEAVDWSVGDEILITTTDTRIDHRERCTIASISGAGTVITLQNPLAYTHIVIHQVFANGEIYHVAAAVGLLSRNIRVISTSPDTEKIGVRVLVTDYSTNIYNAPTSEYINTYYKGYARLSNTQFIGFGQFIDAEDEDKREGIHLYNLGDFNISRPTYVNACSFDTGFYSAIGIWDTNGVPVLNNVVYRAFESAIVATGMNNLIQKNLVSTVYWSGEAEPAYAPFDINNDGAIMSRDAISVVMKDNLVSGAQRQAYRIQGNSCPGTVLPNDTVNDYDNNEAHSSMAGVNMWPNDQGFNYDTDCVLIKGFKTYKTWYYGLYINTEHNIIIDSCQIADSSVGIFTIVLGPLSTTHVFENSSVIIRNSLIIGAITPNDCSDIPDPNTISAINSPTAVPIVAGDSSQGNPGSRVGISFPQFSRDNMIPRHPYTGIDAYPCIGGIMILTNVTFAYFNDMCGSRHDVAISVSQNNDDGQHPVTTSGISVYSSSPSNLVFNGRPNLDVVDPADCVDMDCDGLKTNLLIDTDGTLFGQPSTVFSQAEYLWGNQAHGVGDYRIPSAALAGANGQMININSVYPSRGISHPSACTLQASSEMYLCPNIVDYRMLIIESMDADTETRRLSPVAVLSDLGFINLINGPQDHGWCNGYTCQKRLSTFMTLVESNRHYDIYLSSTTPNDMRFRLLNADATIKVSLALYYTSLQQIDVYANNVYVPPTNIDTSYSYLMLKDIPSGVTYGSGAGTNYFNRTTQTALFLIDGITVIDLEISPLIVLTFGLPATTPAAFFSTNLVGNLAALLGVSVDQIRRVNIISANTDSRVVRRATSGTITLRVELRNDPRPFYSIPDQASVDDINNITSRIINGYQANQTQQQWAAAAGGSYPLSLSVQEPGSSETSVLSVISGLFLITPPSSCRLQSPCDTQPKLVARDASGAIIDKLGSEQQPWQIIAVIVGQSGVSLVGPIANYSDGQSQYTNFGITALGSYQVEFRLLTPNGVSSQFVASASFIVSASSIQVSAPILAGKQWNDIAVVSVNETFNMSTIIVDKPSQIKIGDIQLGSGLQWTATASFYPLQHKCNGTLVQTQSSAVIVDYTAGTITVTNLAINNVGMYIINVELKSTNNQYTIDLTSNGILVKKPNVTLDTYPGYPPSNITYTADFDAINASGKLEITRAEIYNLLTCQLHIPITSDITLRKGSLIAGFMLDGDSIGDAENAQAGVNELITNQVNAIDNTVLQSVNANNDATFTPSTSSSTSGLSAGAIAGIVVAAIVVVAAAAAGSAYGVHKNSVNKGQSLMNEQDEEASISNTQNTTNASPSNDDGSHLTRRLSATGPTSSVTNNNQIQSSSSGQSRPLSSGAASVTGITFNNPVSTLTPVEFIPLH
ncbi:unnamed protein product [Adineta steineri]|uniref:Uncharacterized protein n=1 Tax=Adineta steineri TaxID=433720 RepID=A0A813PSV0_9BILA|nr:unnamed protein product [Adineta steineri]CAF0757269.1 unnamed protein product [Adineta steineri]CAF0865915.1 unnamed protein product [Adineta steineri]